MRAAFALACYVAGAMVTPALHRLHHARYGEDHVHDAAGAHLHHAAFDADTVALDLGDVALAGTLAVDCSLAAYTLVACDDTAAIGHAPNFGDELLARNGRRPVRPPPDPLHGRGAGEHVTPALLVAAPIFLPEPPRAAVSLALAAPSLAPPAPLASAHSARGPPVSLAI
ncbi:MAG: hypothetical protein JWN44_6747 [Myxococcales bacterium]|nr:hypothetical protein [Myxococcales bacterium]